EPDAGADGRPAVADPDHRAARLAVPDPDAHPDAGLPVAEPVTQPDRLTRSGARPAPDPGSGLLADTDAHAHPHPDDQPVVVTLRVAPVTVFAPRRCTG
ncbi:MAG: hypothetical protein JWN54_461, partial [Mycobacterium sp.]|nr:hypothetical protein [Mycobacterium sp.]